jgi:hypothetical protein
MPRLSVWMIRTALIHLGVGFLFGGLMLFNKGVPFAPALWRLLPIHIDLLLFGWMMQLAMGVGFWILPRYSTEPRYGRVWLSQAAFILLNGGILTAAAGQWFNLPVITLLARLMLLASALAFAFHMGPRVRSFGAITLENQRTKG